MYSEIPIITCFDNNYALPASVCFYSLLKNADNNYHYAIYVLQNDITQENKEKLQETIDLFSNANIEFIDMNNQFDNLFKKTKSKNHYSKEIFYKFLIPSLFPQYEKTIVTDVDVIFCGDVSEQYNKFNDDNYLAGCKCLFRKDHSLNSVLSLYNKFFTNEERQALGIAGGYYIYNTKKMREDYIQKKFIDFAEKNYNRLLQPEQDVISLICYPLIKVLPANTLVCSYAYDMYNNPDDYNKDWNYTAEEVLYALNNPMQLHYATSIKPWMNPNTSKSELWYEYLKNTPFYIEFIKKNIISRKEIIYKTKNLLSFKFQSHCIKLIYEKRRKKFR